MVPLSPLAVEVCGEKFSAYDQTESHGNSSEMMVRNASPEVMVESMSPEVGGARNESPQDPVTRTESPYRGEGRGGRGGRRRGEGEGKGNTHVHIVHYTSQKGEQRSQTTHNFQLPQWLMWKNIHVHVLYLYSTWAVHVVQSGAYERRSREGACNSGSIQILISYVVPF